jgi:hypothetical protein
MIIENRLEELAYYMAELGGVYFVRCEKESDSQNFKGIGGRELMERMGHMFPTWSTPSLLPFLFVDRRS